MDDCQGEVTVAKCKTQVSKANDGSSSHKKSFLMAAIAARLSVSCLRDFRMIAEGDSISKLGEAPMVMEARFVYIFPVWVLAGSVSAPDVSVLGQWTSAYGSMHDWIHRYYASHLATVGLP